MRVHFVVHESFEAPGAFAEWAASRAHETSCSRTYAGERLPANADAIDLLIVMGGPQDPDTTTAECPHFDAASEMRLIAECVRGGRAVVGTCLGAQLIGAALGAPCERSPEPEIGCFPVTLSPDGQCCELLADFPPSFDAGHWHGGMPGVLEDSRVLAASAGCPRQIVEYGPLAFGLQCHMEFNAGLVEGLLEHSGADLRAGLGRPFVQDSAAMLEAPFTEMNRLLSGFLDRLAARYEARGNAGA